MMSLENLMAEEWERFVKSLNGTDWETIDRLIMKGKKEDKPEAKPTPTGGDKKQANASLVPVKKTINRNGKSVVETFWVSPEEAEKMTTGKVKDDNHFHVRHGKDWKSVEGKHHDLGNGVHGFSHKDSKGKHVVSELKTGHKISSKGHDTPEKAVEEAVEEAKGLVEKHGDKFKKLINEKVQQHGVSPSSHNRDEKKKAKAIDKQKKTKADNKKQKERGELQTKLRAYRKKVGPERYKEWLKAHGIEWEGNEHQGVDSMRATMAAAEYLKSGKKLDESLLDGKKKDNPKPTVPKSKGEKPKSGGKSGGGDGEKEQVVNRVKDLAKKFDNHVDWAVELQKDPQAFEALKDLVAVTGKHSSELFREFGGGSDTKQEDAKKAEDSLPLTDGAKKQLRKLEDTIRDQPEETAHIVTKNGDVSWSEDGTTNQVDLGDACRKGLTTGAILTHNHPSNSSFSDADVLFMLNWGLHEMRAVGRKPSNGLFPAYNYRIRPPKDDMRPVELHALSEKVEKGIKQADAEIRKEFTTQIGSGKLRVEEANQNHWHEIWTRLSKEFGLRYERSEA